MLGIQPDYRAANREKHLSDEPAAPRQLRPLSSRIGAPGDKVHWRSYTRALLDEYTRNVEEDRND